MQSLVILQQSPCCLENTPSECFLNCERWQQSQMPPGVVSAESGDSPKAQVSDGEICWQQARWYCLVLLLSFCLLSYETLKKNVQLVSCIHVSSLIMWILIMSISECIFAARGHHSCCLKSWEKLFFLMRVISANTEPAIVWPKS